MVVLAGPNGAGKSSVLQALRFFKEHVGPYAPGVQLATYGTRNPVSSGTDFGEIYVNFHLYPAEQTFLRASYGHLVPETLDGRIRFDKAGNIIGRELEPALSQLLQTYSPEVYPDLGTFDYNDAYRLFQETAIVNLSLIGQDSQRERQRRVQPGTTKFAGLKQYLAQLKLAELQQVQREKRFDVTSKLDSIRKLFNQLLSPKEFIDVDIGVSPAKFTVKTPSGDVDFDDLSSGEKEVLFFYVDLMRLNLTNSIVLIDEPDLHLNQELERKILPLLRSMGANNQFWIATHSLPIMASVDHSELFRLDNYSGKNQLSRIFDSQHKYELFSAVAGEVGIVTLGEKVVFCEGALHSDVVVLRTWFDQLKGKVVFVPSGGKSETMLLSEKLLELLEVSSTHSQYFAIRDRDFLSDSERKELLSKSGGRLKVWDRYEIENYLLDFDAIAEVANELGAGTEKTTPRIVEKELLEAAKAQRKLFATKLALHHINGRLRKARARIIIDENEELVGVDSILAPIMTKHEVQATIEASTKDVDSWLASAWVERLPAKLILAKYVNAQVSGVRYDRFKSLLVLKIAERKRIPATVTSSIDEIVNTR